MKKQCTIICLLALTWLTAIGCGPAPRLHKRPNFSRPTRYEPTDEEIEQSLGSDRLKYMVNGRQIGWMESSLEHDKKQGIYRLRIETTRHSRHDGKRQTTSYGVTEEFLDRAPYTLLKGEQHYSWGGRSETVTVLRQDNEKYRAEIREGSAFRERSIKDVDYTLADALSVSAWILREKPQPGQTLCVRLFDYDRLQTIVDRNRLKHYCELQDGKRGAVLETLDESGYRQQVVYDRKGWIRRVSWHPQIELRPGQDNGYRSIEPLDMAIMLDSNRFLGKPEKHRRLKIKVSGPAASCFAEAPGQKVRRRKDTATITTGTGRRVKAGDWETQLCSQATVNYPADDVEVLKLAKKAVRGAKSQKEKARRLTRFVHNYLEYQSADEPLNVLETIRLRRGDCSNYSTLYTTLARAVGLPARSVTGLAGGGDKFGAHAWNEVVLGGDWIPVDACWNQGPGRVDGTHVRFGIEPHDSMLAMHHLSKSKLSVVRTQTAGSVWFWWLVKWGMLLLGARILWCIVFGEDEQATTAESQRHKYSTPPKPIWPTDNTQTPPSQISFPLSGFHWEGLSSGNVGGGALTTEQVLERARQQDQLSNHSLPLSGFQLGGLSGGNVGGGALTTEQVLERARQQDQLSEFLRLHMGKDGCNTG